MPHPSPPNLGYINPPTAISTRRFKARPVSFELLAIGLASPYHDDYRIRAVSAAARSWRYTLKAEDVQHRMPKKDTDRLSFLIKEQGATIEVPVLRTQPVRRCTDPLSQPPADSPTRRAAFAYIRSRSGKASRRRRSRAAGTPEREESGTGPRGPSRRAAAGTACCLGE